MWNVKELDAFNDVRKISVAKNLTGTRRDLDFFLIGKLFREVQLHFSSTHETKYETKKRKKRNVRRNVLSRFFLKRFAHDLRQLQADFDCDAVELPRLRLRISWQD